MRTAAVAVAISMAPADWSVADEATTIVRKYTNISQQSLGAALRALAKDRSLQILFRSDLVRDRRTAGAVGEFTIDEALTRLLAGTALTFQYLDDRTITIVSTDRVGSDAAQTTSGTRRFSRKQLRVVRADDSMTRVTQEEGYESSTSGARRMGLEEVIVTAQKRAQDIQDVPISITAFSEDGIRNARIDSLQDYMELSPNVGYFTNGMPTGDTITIRGVSNLGGYVNGLGIYVDEFNVSPGRASATYEQSLLDLEHIEVLRGPQGVLYGRNLIAGAISLTTRKPARQFEAAIDADYGSHDTWELKGVMNLPLSDRAAVRLSGFTRESDGFLDNVGAADSNDGYEASGGRIALRLAPTESLTLDLTVAQTGHSQGTADLVPTGVLADILTNLGISGATDSGQGFWPANTDRVATELPSYVTNDTTLLIGRVEWDLGEFSLVSVSGYIDNEATNGGDGDRTAIRYYVDDNKEELESYSTELRLQSDEGAAFDWVIGGAYTHDETASNYLRVLQPAFLALFELDGTRRILDRRDELSSQSYAVFGDLTWHLHERLDLSAGGRYTHDRVKNVFYDNSQGFGNGVAADQLSSGTQEFSDFSPRLSAVLRATPNLNLYMVLSRGYKAGGHNLGLEQDPNLPVRFNKEIAWNYEAGLKGGFFDQRLRASLALFYMKWNDIQVDAGFFNEELILFTFVQNAAKASSQGVELELEAQPLRGLQLRLGLGYNEATFDRFPNSVNDAGGIEDLAGKTLPLAPEWSFNGSVQYSFPLAAKLEGFARVEYAYKDEQFLTMTNKRTLARYTPAYDTANLRLGIDSGRYRLTAYAENLLDEHIIGGSYITYMSGVGLVLDRRRYGLQLSVSFD